MRRIIIFLCCFLLIFSLSIPCFASSSDIDLEKINSIDDSSTKVYVEVDGISYVLTLPNYEINENQPIFKTIVADYLVDISFSTYAEDIYIYFLEDNEYVLYDDITVECFNFVNYFGSASSKYAFISNGTIVEQGEATPPATEDTDSELHTLIQKNNELLEHIYTAMLFTLGVSCAVFVIFLLYKFIRKFF